MLTETLFRACTTWWLYPLIIQSFMMNRWFEYPTWNNTHTDLLSTWLCVHKGTRLVAWGHGSHGISILWGSLPCGFFLAIDQHNKLEFSIVTWHPQIPHFLSLWAHMRFAATSSFLAFSPGMGHKYGRMLISFKSIRTFSASFSPNMIFMKLFVAFFLQCITFNVLRIKKLCSTKIYHVSYRCISNRRW